MSDQPIAVSVKTAAGLTDFSESTVREAIDKQVLPAYRNGRVIRVLRVDLEQWIAGMTRVGSEGDR